MEDYKNKHVEKMLDMPPEARKRRIRASKCMFIKRTPKRKMVKAEDWSRDKIINWAKLNKINTLIDYKNWIKNPNNVNGPSLRLILKIFQKWSWLVKAVSGEDREMMKWPKEGLADYIVKLIAMKGVISPAGYKQIVKEKPDIYPGIHHIDDLFGSWTKMMYLVKRSNPRLVLDLYRSVKKELGRWPTLCECSTRHIDLKPFIELHGSKDKLDAMLENAEDANEKRSGS